MTRRELLTLAAAGAVQAAPIAPLIDTHIHLFEPTRFPYHALGTYQPPPEPLGPYLAFTKAAGIAHSVIVHPEPYQDDHRYLWHCFESETPPGYFKGTLLLDPIDPRTPARMAELVKAHPHRIVALRIHAMNAPGEPPEKSGSIRNRDLADRRIQQVWRKAADLDIAIQMHFLPHHAPEIGTLCRRFPQVTVLLDHMGRTGMGTPADVDSVMALAKYPKVYFKYSGWSYFTNPALPVGPIVQRAHREFGADRILWGGLGMNAKAHAEAERIFATHWAFAPAEDREKIRGRNAARLFHFE
ncbi:amidohydrolase family protein [uncultured Paludibaculum sp.]|uniref:amidohydrolase family protein n=1 Tax=uncultured Paludibaculum sp. TaxID=1765020 RepID=UPI002AAB8638|nr:amidohydrolase family protein [uncultured Paludibaculum sp.]